MRTIVARMRPSASGSQEMRIGTIERTLCGRPVSGHCECMLDGDALAMWVSAALGLAGLWALGARSTSADRTQEPRVRPLSRRTRSGTCFHHPHVGVQLGRGPYAPIIIDDPAEPGAYELA